MMPPSVFSCVALEQHEQHDHHVTTATYNNAFESGLNWIQLGFVPAGDVEPSERVPAVGSNMNVEIVLVTTCHCEMRRFTGGDEPGVAASDNGVVGECSCADVDHGSGDGVGSLGRKNKRSKRSWKSCVG